ncbi:MAG TPA: alpha/beta fold hydrolase [Actinomycetota bacterium]|nr:alpha/beta fold hydrolase [Actinomycetota bacterium]
MRKVWLTIAALALVTGACGGTDEEPPASAIGATASSSASPEATPFEAAEVSSFPAFSREELIAMSEPVKVRAAEGVRIAGRLFGSGEVGVILDHMGAGDQSQWFEFAGQLAKQGYLVLTYDRRGSCPGGELGCSSGTDDGDGWRDLAFLADFLRGEGAERVVVGGASQGAMESLYALSEGLDADGLIWVAGVDLYNGVPLSEQVADVRVPKLFISGDADGEAAATLDEFETAPPPSEIVRLDTGEHGTNILAYAPVAVADKFRQSVVDFLETI